MHDFSLRLPTSLATAVQSITSLPPQFFKYFFVPKIKLEISLSLQDLPVPLFEVKVVEEDEEEEDDEVDDDVDIEYEFAAIAAFSCLHLSRLW